VGEQKELSGLAICKKAYGGYSHNWDSVVQFDLCVSCREKLGLVKRVLKEDSVAVEEVDVKDRLYNIFAELVEDILGEQQIAQ